MDRKLIAQWQGHQDGGQLILDTYTQVFGSDDEEYVRGQLAKIGGGVPPADAVAQFCGGDVDEAPSKGMKKPKNAADPAPVPVTAPPVVPAVPSTNPYQKGDKVTTACKGAEVEAAVTAVFKDEVQVRTPDGELRWRTIRTVQPVIVLLTPPDPMDEMDVVEPPVVVPRKRKRATKTRR